MLFGAKQAVLLWTRNMDNRKICGLTMLSQYDNVFSQHGTGEYVPSNSYGPSPLWESQEQKLSIEDLTSSLLWLRAAPFYQSKKSHRELRSLRAQLTVFCRHWKSVDLSNDMGGARLGWDQPC